jgi:hypothetical protein
MGSPKTSGDSAMQATAPEVQLRNSGETGTRVDLFEARREDAYWERSYWRERYVRPDLNYEDYAPAYCVGYIGCAQYGGAFEDAQPWLCANWERIKGDSRLPLKDALLAMRSAWERMASRRDVRRALRIASVGQLRRRLSMPSFKLSARLGR